MKLVKRNQAGRVFLTGTDECDEQAPDHVELEWMLDGESWVESPELLAKKARRVWTPLFFLTQVLLPAELAAIFAEAKTDNEVGMFYDLAKAAQEIVSDSPLTVQGLALLVSKQLITEERRTEILATPSGSL